MDYKQALEYIHGVSWLGSKPGLSRTRALLDHMGNPQDKLRFIHVAGTNGKGSTCAMLASVLKAAGCKTGLYTSPYIVRFNERMQINGVEISDTELAEITEYVKRFADTLEDTPTEFELVTAIGFEYFYRNACDVVVLEVGMGGALDSTNVIAAPLLAIITELALDHTAVLGATLAEIASAKAGIIKPGCAVLSADNTAEGAAVIADTCNRLGCPHFTPDYAAVTEKECTTDGIAFSYHGERYKIALCGTYQFRNAAVVLKAVELLRKGGMHIEAAAVASGLAAVRWRARFELLNESPAFIYDGGHNPQGVAAAIESYRARYGSVKPVVLIGLMADKDYKKELVMLSALTDRFVAVKPCNPRALAEESLAGEICALGCDCVAAESVAKGVEAAVQIANGKCPVLALGSLYMYGEVYAATEKLFSHLG